MRGRVQIGGAIAIALGTIVIACGHADIEGTPLAGARVTTSATEPGQCEGPENLEVTDPSTLPPCCDGAHCLAKEKVPGKVRKSLATCPGGYCVPDSFLTSGGAPAKTCTAFGKEGACASTCLPEVARNTSLLQQDTCGALELCAPCVNPLTQQATGICEIGKPGAGSCEDDGEAAPVTPPKCPHEGPPVIDPLTLPSCGNVSGSHCMKKELVSPDMASRLAPCPEGYCVPDVFIASGGNFIPPSCKSLGGAEGRCLHVSLPSVSSQIDRLPQDACGPRERCAPCFSPVDGSDTGACKLSCDPGPKDAPYLFPTCCALGGADRGRCVPATSVPASERENLRKDTCAAPSDLCAPGENLDDAFQPKSCTAFSAVYLGNYQGVCLSECLHFSGLQALAIAKGNCDAVHQCVPCRTPTGSPTGAPGCP
ncbi:MAG: hypothetical protein KF819_12330 [Labilithrix sp.]|nr:hypothetical protein [Labilithrix sp.]